MVKNDKIIYDYKYKDGLVFFTKSLERNNIMPGGDGTGPPSGSGPGTGQGGGGK